MVFNFRCPFIYCVFLEIYVHILSSFVFLFQYYMNVNYVYIKYLEVNKEINIRQFEEK